MSELNIPLDNVKSDFQSQLEIEGNSRLLFSGRFGVGKTFFLKSFFKDYAASYEVFHLFPVNYQIHSNEDILELIKYDILVSLLDKDQKIFKRNDLQSLIDLQRLLYIWGKDNIKEIGLTSISLIPKLGRPLAEISGLINQFINFKNKIEKGEQGFVEKYLSDLSKQDISETDYLSELLRNKIQTIKDRLFRLSYGYNSNPPHSNSIAMR